MPQHVVVDGSNIATEGRSQPSLKQLNEAVLAFMEEHPEALITVVVDATFGHRIDPKEAAEFDEAVNNNELVAPPAGAIGRGDAFVLSIANKVKAIILSNDSFQEFHGQYDWLFEEGRLIGGKPVPHIGWVFVPRLPVRGPLSRKVTAEAKRRGRGAKAAGTGTDTGTVRVGSADASQPMPVPTAPPPGAALPGKRGAKAAPAKQAAPAKDTVAAAPAASTTPAPKQSTVNELLDFLTFVERHPAGTSVNAIVDHYSSHGAYVKVGDIMGYVPLRLMADPAPRSAREFMKVGEAITLVVDKYVPEKRSIDLAIPGMGTVPAIEPKAEKPAKSEKAPAKPRKAAAKKVAEKAVDPVVEAAPVEAATPTPAKPKRATKKAAAPAEETPVADTPPVVAPVKKAAAKKAATPAAEVPVKKAPAKKAPAKKAATPAVDAPAKKVPAKKAAAKKAPAKKAAAKSETA